MKRTQAGKITARFLELYALPHHLDHVDAAKQIVDKSLWNLTCHGLRASSRNTLVGGSNVIRPRA